MSALQLLVDMFAKGGLEVTTFSAGDDSENGRLPLIRTVIQPNANIITWVQPGVENPKAWEEHYEKLNNKIRSIRRIRQLINYSSIAVIAAYIAVFNLVTQDLYGWLIRLVISIVGAILLRSLLKLSLRWYIRKQINKYLSFST